MTKTDFLSGPLPRVFAHRGLHLHKSGVDENSIQAFQEAIIHGATHIESDVHATSDGVAVLFHDENLARVASIPRLIAELTFEQLSQISLDNGARIPSLSQVLLEFPDLFLNLDIKSREAISPTVLAIENASAHDRVLVSSFSNSRRLEALKLLTKPVATSGSMRQVILAWLSHSLLCGVGFPRIVREIDAFQIPPRRGVIRFDRESFIARANKHRTEVHFWTINDPLEMKRLLALGASGIVSDRVDLFPKG